MKELIVIVGPVSSDKSTQAVIQARTRALTGSVLIVRPSMALRPRQGEKRDLLRTKSGLDASCWDIESAHDLYTLPKADVYVIEEPTLLPEDRKDAVVYHAVTRLRQNAMVIVVGLGATSEMHPFGNSMGLLLQVADDIRYMKGLCNWCSRHESATRSVYVGDQMKESDVQVGGVESYRPACPSCYDTVMKEPPGSRLLSATVKPPKLVQEGR